MMFSHNHAQRGSKPLLFSFFLKSCEKKHIFFLLFALLLVPYRFWQSSDSFGTYANFCKVCKNLTGAGGRRRRGGCSVQPAADAAGYRQPAGFPFRQPAVPFNLRISRCPSIPGPFDVKVRVVYVESCRPPAKKPEFAGSLRLCVQTTRT